MLSINTSNGNVLYSLFVLNCYYLDNQCRVINILGLNIKKKNFDYHEIQAQTLLYIIDAFLDKVYCIYTLLAIVFSYFPLCKVQRTKFIYKVITLYNSGRQTLRRTTNIVSDVPSLVLCII